MARDGTVMDEVLRNAPATILSGSKFSGTNQGEEGMGSTLLKPNYGRKDAPAYSGSIALGNGLSFEGQYQRDKFLGTNTGFGLKFSKDF